MAEIVDKYAFALMLDSSNFSKGANVAMSLANGLKTTMLNTYTAIGGLDLFKSLITDYAEYGNSIDRINMLTGENITEIQAWEKTIKDTGGNVSGFNNTLQGLSNMLAEIQNYGTSGSLGIFQRLGIDTRKSNGELKTSTELLFDISKKINKLDPKRSFNFAKDLGLDESVFIAMRRYGDNLEKVINSNKKYAIINERGILLSREYQRNISSFKIAWMQLSEVLGTNLLPIIQDEIFPEIDKLTKYLFANKGELKQYFSDLKVWVSDVMPVVEGFVKSLGGIASFGKWFAETTGGAVGTVVGETQKIVKSGSFGKAFIPAEAQSLMAINKAQANTPSVTYNISVPKIEIVGSKSPEETANAVKYGLLNVGNTVNYLGYNVGGAQR